MRRGQQTTVGVAIALTGCLLLFGRGGAKAQIGDKITLTRVAFDCKGQAATLYLGWGLAREAGDFEEGAGLIAGTWASGGPMAVEASAELRLYDFTPAEDFETQPVLYLEPGAAELIPGQYDTWVWFSMGKASTSEDDIVALFRQPKALTIGG